MKYTSILLLLFLGISWGQNPGRYAGLASNVFLRSDLPARTSALSGAFTAVADDETALYYNPAGLANVNFSSLSLNHSEWFEDIRIDNLIFTYKIDSKLGWAVGIAHLGMPAIQGKDIYGQPTQKLNVSSSYIQLGFGYKIMPAFYLGLAVKYFQDNLASYKADGLGVDLGFYMYTFIPGVTFAAAVQNLGAKFQYDVQKEQLPMTYRVGIAYKSYALRGLLLTLDVRKSIDTEYVPSIGLEYKYRNAISIQLGSRMVERDRIEPTIGAGLTISNKYFFNYAYFMSNNLGVTHKVGFSVRFGKKGFKARTKHYSGLSATSLRPPENVESYIVGNQLIIRWDRVSGARYNVYAKGNNQTKWSKLNRHPLYSNQMKFKKPRKGEKIRVKVTAIINARESSFSKEVVIESR